MRGRDGHTDSNHKHHTHTHPHTRSQHHRGGRKALSTHAGPTHTHTPGPAYACRSFTRMSGSR